MGMMIVKKKQTHRAPATGGMGHLSEAKTELSAKHNGISCTRTEELAAIGGPGDVCGSVLWVALSARAGRILTLGLLSHFTIGLAQLVNHAGDSTKHHTLGQAATALQLRMPHLFLVYCVLDAPTFVTAS